jgi:single-stranded-DNA-specific exonuclease
MKIKNIEKASDRIKKAVLNNEQFILYGDSDLDGISSVVILEEAIKNLGGEKIDVFFPDRENDGYGINKKSLEFLKEKAPALLITLDLGIGNVEEVLWAEKYGFEVIIVDHHEPLDKVPGVKIIVDPKQKDDPYPFKGLANIGVTFRLCEELLGKNMSESLRKSFLELTALATIADMVPQIDENKIFIEEGLRYLKNTFRPGLRALLDILGEGAVLSGGISKLNSALNAAEDLVHKDNESYMLLTSSSKKDCQRMAQELIDKTISKQFKIKAISEEVERRYAQKLSEPIIFEGDASWKLTLAGSVASIISNKYQKPTFIYKKMTDESCGSVRNPVGTDSVEAMSQSKDFLITYGGHQRASGFRVKNIDLEFFKKNLITYFSK